MNTFSSASPLVGLAPRRPRPSSAKLAALLLVAAFTLASAYPAAAQVFYTRNTTISTAIGDGAEIGYANYNDRNNQVNGTSPTFNLVNGGSLNYIDAYNSSTINISGGSVADSPYAYDSSKINITGGTISNDTEAYGSSVVTISGGSFGRYSGINFFDATSGSFSLVGTGLSYYAAGTYQSTGFFGGTTNWAVYGVTGLLKGGQDVAGEKIAVRSGTKMFTLTQAPAQNYYITGNAAINYSVVGSAIVGYGSASDYGNRVNGTSNTVTFTNSSSVSGALVPGGNSTVNVNGGSFADVVPLGNGKLNMSGGHASGVLYAEDNSTVVMSGGTVDQYLACGSNGTVTITGGTINGDVFADSGKVTLSGGIVGGYVSTTGSSSVNISGGTVSGYVASENTSTVNISGGMVARSLQTYDSSTVTISGGTFVQGLYANDGSAVDISGGTFGQYTNVNFYDRTTGSFNFTGTGFSAASLGADASGGIDYFLTGLLQGGQSITGDVINVQPGASRFTFNGLDGLNPAPEPSQVATLSLMGLGLGGLLLRARRRRMAAGR